MRTFEVRSKKAKLIIAEVNAKDARAAFIAASQEIGCTLDELERKIPSEYSLVEIQHAPKFSPKRALPRRSLFEASLSEPTP